MKSLRQKHLSKLRGRIKAYIESCDPVTLVEIAEQFRIPVPPTLISLLEEPDDKEQ